MIAYVLPTRNRPVMLARTLAALGQLSAHDAEVIVVDNASSPPAQVPSMLENGLSVTMVMRATNAGASARTAGVLASDSSAEWIVMLDDDSVPMHTGFVEALCEQPKDVAAVAGEIFLGSSAHRHAGGAAWARREAGGLPEVFVGCGVAIRRDAYLGAGGAAGYDPAFGFYAEEYDLAARFILDGQRVVLDRRFAVHHEKTSSGRDMNAIVHKLVRNNAWVMTRYAPARVRVHEVSRTLTRYAHIARRERALMGYTRGLCELSTSIWRQLRREMSSLQWDRFTGKACCQRSLQATWSRQKFKSAQIVAPGKNEHVVREVLEDMGVRVMSAPADARGGPARAQEADVCVIGTLSPGPMLDAWEIFQSTSGVERVVVPWEQLVNGVSEERVEKSVGGAARAA